MSKLLSICIPTYNRAGYLNICIKSIVSQLSDISKNLLEIVIIDNDSSDDTKDVVSSYINNGHDIRYIKNSTNIGLDGNITKAFDVATAKYVLIFGDDDLFFKGKIAKLLNILSKTDAGVVYLKPIGFVTYDDSLGDQCQTNMTYLFKNANDFLSKVGLMTTFTSSNVINKDLVLKQSSFELNRFLGTEVNLLNWIFTAALNSQVNLITQDHYLASQSDNNSGYKFFRVFGKNFNDVMDHFIAHGGLHSKVVERVNYVLTTAFFPKYLEKIHSDDWTFDDKKEEILLFLEQYRNKDFFCRLFLIDTYKNGVNVSASTKILKAFIITYYSALYKFSFLGKIIGGRVQVKKY